MLLGSHTDKEELEIVKWPEIKPVRVLVLVVECHHSMRESG